MLDFDAWFAGRRDEEEELRRLRRLATTKAGLRRQHLRLEALEAEVAWLRLLTRALAELSLEKGLISEEELRERLRKFDASDGVEDGKSAADPFAPAPSPAPLPPPKPVRRRRFRPRV